MSAFTCPVCDNDLQQQQEHTGVDDRCMSCAVLGTEWYFRATAHGVLRAMGFAPTLKEARAEIPSELRSAVRWLGSPDALVGLSADEAIRVELTRVLKPHPYRVRVRHQTSGREWVETHTARDEEQAATHAAMAGDLDVLDVRRA